MGIESQQGSYQHSSTATGAANRAVTKNAGYGGVRFRDTKGEGKQQDKSKRIRTRFPRQPNWSAAGISDAKTQQYGPQTVAEVAESRSGIAPTAKNMGSLAVQYRADEATAIKAGELTDRNKRDQRIIDARGVGGAPQGDSGMDAFKKKYWGAREVWASDKGAYSEVVPTGSEGPHSQRTAPTRSGGGLGASSASRRRPGTAPRDPVRSNSKYGLF